MSIRQTRFRVTGMKCAGCIARGREALAKLAGVTDAEFDLATGTAVISGSVEPQAVIRVLSDAGYGATVETQ
jgi:copper chaperone CopZ